MATLPYPSQEEIEKADRVQLAKWYRFLPSPHHDDEIPLLNRICERFAEQGGMAPAISKAIGWN